MSVHLKAAYRARIQKLETELQAKKAESNVTQADLSAAQVELNAKKAELHAAIDELKIKDFHEAAIAWPIEARGEAVEAMLDAIGDEKTREIKDREAKAIAEATSMYPDPTDLKGKIEIIKNNMFMLYLVAVQVP